MIKVYLDWNVFVQLKNEQHKELKDILYNNEKFIIPFSTSHIGDIFSSYNEEEGITEYIDSDLQFISDLTKNFCLYNNGKTIVSGFYSPKELFQQKIDDKDLMQNPFDFINEACSELGISNPFNLIKNMPLESIFAQNSASINLLPGLKDNLTFGGLVESIIKMQKSLNEEEGYKDLRKILQSELDINKDKISNLKDPISLIETSYKKQNINQKDFLKEHFENKTAPNWFNDIINEYINLDMHGYHEDKVTTKGRKETFKNTTEDALHAAFASMCNFYVTNDKKSYIKTKQVYEKLGLNTIVMKPDEFIENYNDYIKFDNLVKLNCFFWWLKNGNFTNTLENNNLWAISYFPIFLFDFFNKIIILTTDDDESTVALSQYMSNGYIYSIEIKKLVTDICEILGEDIDGLGEVQEKEFEIEEWIGRKWKSENTSFKLIRLNRIFQLYIEPLFEK